MTPASVLSRRARSPRPRAIAHGCVAVLLFTGAASAAEGPREPTESGEHSSGLGQQLANPIANLIQVPLKSNFDYGAKDGRSDAFRYTLNIEPVVPFSLSENWNLITRTIIPVTHVERLFPTYESGLGDVVQSFFLSPAKPVNGVTWGVGPVFLYPTATDEVLGHHQWGSGVTGIVLQQNGHWLYGVLANHIWSLSNETFGRERVNASFLQPFLTYTFPKTQTTVFLSSESTYDWASRQWMVPINLGLNQLAKIGPQVIQVGGLVRYYAETPQGGPGWGFQLRLTYVFPRAH